MSVGLQSACACVCVCASSSSVHSLLDSTGRALFWPPTDSENKQALLLLLSLPSSRLIAVCLCVLAFFSSAFRCCPPPLFVADVVVVTVDCCVCVCVSCVCVCVCVCVSCACVCVRHGWEDDRLPPPRPCVSSACDRVMHTHPIRGCCYGRPRMYPASVGSTFRLREGPTEKQSAHQQSSRDIPRYKRTREFCCGSSGSAAGLWRGSS